MWSSVIFKSIGGNWLHFAGSPATLIILFPLPHLPLDDALEPPFILQPGKDRNGYAKHKAQDAHRNKITYADHGNHGE